MEVDDIFGYDKLVVVEKATCSRKRFTQHRRPHMPLLYHPPRQLSRVRSGGNKSTEVRLIGLLRRHEVTGWRRRYPLIGNPDFVFPSVRLAVFVDGCFWHGHPRLCRLPATNRHYWIPKIQRNRQRDRKVGIALRSRGWRIVRIWEHELRTKGDQCVRKIQRHI